MTVSMRVMRTRNGYNYPLRSDAAAEGDRSMALPRAGSESPLHDRAVKVILQYAVYLSAYRLGRGSGALRRSEGRALIVMNALDGYGQSGVLLALCSFAPGDLSLM